MINIAQWLIYVEHLAGNLYDAAATKFIDDNELSTFLKHLAEDEADHYHVMGSAAEYIRREGNYSSYISIDEDTQKQIEGPFKECNKLFENNELNIKILLDCIATTELSEWNHIYLYVVNTLKLRSREFMPVASRMQQHMAEIIDFIKNHSATSDNIRKLLQLPTVWEKKILIVENTSPIAELLTAVLQEKGSVDVALNGDQGLEKTVHTHYDVIISDVDMPIMNGIEFIKRAAKHDKNIHKRVIFFTSSDLSEHEEFLKHNKIAILHKPASLIDIRKAVDTVLGAERK